MKLRTLSAVLTTAGILACASQAAASGFFLSFQGFVDYGHDDTNIFGLGAGANLGGQSITQSFLVDYNAGANHDISGDPSYFRDSIGGPGFITSAVTINGVTTSIGSQTGIDDRTDEHLDPNPCGSCKSGFSEFTGDESFSNYVDANSGHNMLESWGMDGGDFGQSLGYHPSLAFGAPVFTAADNLDLFGTFTIYHSLFDQTAGMQVFDHETTAKFTADTVTIRSFGDVAVDGGVPEPATWGLLILGFGATGAALRRRRLAGVLA
jgi:hypothetical protein